MPSYDLLISFAIATIIFGYMPGPALLYTAAQTLARGKRAGFMAAIGIHVGCYAHVFAATLGLSAIFTHVPLAFTVVKIAGALYLIWLGINIIYQRQKPDSTTKRPELIAPKSARRAFLESIVVELLNPKVAIFFIAFLPQFVDPNASLPIWSQFLILGILVNITFTSADLLTVLLASMVMNKAKNSNSMQTFARAVGGSILIGLGIHLAIQKN